VDSTTLELTEGPMVAWQARYPLNSPTHEKGPGTHTANASRHPVLRQISEQEAPPLPDEETHGGYHSRSASISVRLWGCRRLIRQSLFRDGFRRRLDYSSRVGQRLGVRWPPCECQDFHEIHLWAAILTICGTAHKTKGMSCHGRRGVTFPNSKESASSSQPHTHLQRRAAV
jgi:hypothetical protein